ncbi:TPA_asm: hypothetical protein G2917_21780 [Salmonella enterica subsp. houtenae]|nr:hypothetical protein [Salmonella enterica subsp. houtenae]
MQAAARKVKGAGVAAGSGVTGAFPAWCSIDQRSGAVKKCIVCNAGPPSRCSATRCLQRSAPVKGSTVLTEQVLLSGCEAKGAVNDSIEQEGDYNCFTWMKRGNLFSGN